VVLALSEAYDDIVECERHVRCIQAARAAADDADIPLVINGRTDVFWRDIGPASERVDHAIERANAYYDAGSDCLFVPGVSDAAVIEALVDGVDGPQDVLGSPGAPPSPEHDELGVARISVGSGPMRATLGLLQTISTELRTDGTYSSMENGVPYNDLNAMLFASSGSRTV
jgi:2-methylisocitrate lyase-like PEP mutase family enzyme